MTITLHFLNGKKQRVLFNSHVWRGIMKKIIGIGLAVLLLGSVGYRVITHGEEPAIKDIDAYQEELGIPVEVQKVERNKLTISRNFTGTIEGAKQADAIANTAQKVVAIPVKVGEKVQKGQIVAKLDINIASGMSLKYSQTQASLEAAKKDLKRMTSLYEAGAVSEQVYDDFVLQHAIALKNYEAASQLVQIPSPISGMVTHVFYKVGETATTGRPVVRIAKLDEVLIEISINETEIAGIQNGQEAVVLVAAYPKQAFTGKLEDLSFSADPVSRSFTAWVRVGNKELLLRPGMFAKVKVLVTARENVLTVSKDAIVEKDDKTLAYVVNSEQVAELREVRIGQTSGNIVEIQSGLVENERVVVLGQNKLQPGKKVNIIQTGS